MQTIVETPTYLDIASKLFSDREAARQQTAEYIDSLHSQPTYGLRTANFATGMGLAMRIAQALRRPAAGFAYAADWQHERYGFHHPKFRLFRCWVGDPNQLNRRS